MKLTYNQIFLANTAISKIKSLPGPMSLKAARLKQIFDSYVKALEESKLEMYKKHGVELKPIGVNQAQLMENGKPLSQSSDTFKKINNELVELLNQEDDVQVDNYILPLNELTSEYSLDPNVIVDLGPLAKIE